LKVRSYLLGVLAFGLAMACQPTSPQPSSSTCQKAQVPAGTTLVARVCDENTADRLFAVVPAQQALSAVRDSTARPNTLSVSLPFDPHNGPFMLVKYQTTAGWEEYGVIVFDRALMVRSVLDCPNSSRAPSLWAGPSVTGLAYIAGVGEFSEMVGTPAIYLLDSKKPMIFAGEAVFKVSPTSPKISPHGLSLVFSYNQASPKSTRTTTSLIKDNRGLIWYLGG